MFATKKQPALRSLVGEGTVIQGTLEFSDGLRIDGEIQGDVICSQSGGVLIISEKAKVVGAVKAAHAIINGTIIGPVECTTLLELQSKARIQGDIRYESLEMQQGAIVEGGLQRVAGSTMPAIVNNDDKPALKLLAANNQ